MYLRKYKFVRKICNCCGLEFSAIKINQNYCSRKCKVKADNLKVRDKSIEKRKSIKVESLEGEVWKPVLNYEGLYEVSNKGRLKSLLTTTTIRGYETFLPEAIMKCCVSQYGYWKSTLTKNKIRKSILLHRLVAEAFIPNPENKPQVNHIDGDKLNSDVSNLEWCTCLENIHHALKTGLKKPKKK